MPKYTIKSPDGTFTVIAPEGTTREQVVARVQAHAKANPPGSRGLQDNVGGTAGAYLDGLLPGSSGFLGGVGRMVKESIAAPFSDQIDFNPMESYNRGKRLQEDRNRRAMISHPRLTGAAQLGGIAGGLLLPASKIARGASLTQKAKAGALTGAGYGAISGGMASDADTLAGKFSDSLTGGMLGGGIGAAAPIVLKGAEHLYAPFKPLTAPIVHGAAQALQKVGQYLPGSLGRTAVAEGQQLARDPVRAEANRRLDATIRDSAHPHTGAPMRPMEVLEEVKRRQAQGVPAIAADLNEGMRSRFRTAARSPGPATSRVRQMIDERKAQEASRVQQHLGETLGSPVNVEGQARTLSNEAREAAAPLYSRSNAQEVPYTAELQELLGRPSARDAVQVAGREILDQGKSPRALGLVQDAEGNFHVGDAPTMELYDHVKTVLDKTAFDGSKPLATTEVSRASAGAKSIRTRLLAIMDGIDDTPGLNPAWKEAREAYAGPTQNRQALELGQDLTKATAPELANAVDGLTESQRQFFRLGHRSGLSQDLRALPDYGDFVGRLAGTADRREGLAATHGAEATQSLMDRIGPEQDAAQTWQAVRGTPPDGIPDFASQEEQIANAASGFLQTLAGHPGAGFGTMARAVASGQRNGQEVNGHIASVLAEQDPEALRGAIRDMLRERARRAKVDRNANLATQHTGRLLGSVSAIGAVDMPED